MDNYQIADHFSLLSKLMDIHGENSFKSKSYAIAAFNIEKLTVELDAISEEKLFAIKGIGEATGQKILELNSTGKMKILEDLIKKTPEGILEMLNISGLGPKKINTVWKEMGIQNLDELLEACNENRLSSFKGFGEKTQAAIKTSIELMQLNVGNNLFAAVENLSIEVEEVLSKLFSKEKVNITGGMARHDETISMLEYVVMGKSETILSKMESVDYFTLALSAEDKLLYKTENGTTVCIYPATARNFVQRIFDTTGQPEFLSAFHSAFPDANFDNLEDEKQLFKQLRIQYIPSYNREDASIIGLAKNKAIPEVVEYSDIKGLIHSHSNWSDGSHELEVLCSAAKEEGLEYLVISDHSKAAFYANGLNEERVIAQQEMIDELNRKLKPFRIFKSIESDILNDGSLDYPDEVLARFDLVIASVHSNLKMNEEKATARIIKAIENPYTTILGHMTGRKLLNRNGLPVDHIKIIDACAANDVVIEINAHPRRLDMRWQWLQYALEKNVLISIDPDAHSIPEFKNNRYGVLVAQKGLLTKEQNLSSFSLSQFEKFIRQRKKKKGI